MSILGNLVDTRMYKEENNIRALFHSLEINTSTFGYAFA